MNFHFRKHNTTKVVRCQFVDRFSFPLRAEYKKRNWIPFVCTKFSYKSEPIGAEFLHFSFYSFILVIHFFLLGSIHANGIDQRWRTRLFAYINKENIHRKIAQ